MNILFPISVGLCFGLFIWCCVLYNLYKFHKERGEGYFRWLKHLESKGVDVSIPVFKMEKEDAVKYGLWNGFKDGQEKE